MKKQYNTPNATGGGGVSSILDTSPADVLYIDVVTGEIRICTGENTIGNTPIAFTVDKLIGPGSKDMFGLIPKSTKNVILHNMNQFKIIPFEVFLDSLDVCEYPE